MRFALLGDHPDGLDMARALVESGRHDVIAYCGPSSALETLSRWGMKPEPVVDIEEVLADPVIEGVIVAGGMAARAGQWRRALQSERHVLCVHPAGNTADLAYEADMLRGDVRCVLLPLLPEALHPGIRRLAQVANSPAPPTGITAHLDGITTMPLQALPVQSSKRLQMLEIERWSSEEVLLQTEQVGKHASLPGWDTLRRLGGEVQELFALASTHELGPETPLLLSGQFVRGGLFHATLLPGQSENRLRLTMITATGRAELLFPQGWPGPAQLSYRDAEGETHTESWPAEDPWPSVVACFEAELGGRGRDEPVLLSWKDAVRALELDDAVRRSVHRRRASTLDYQEATEEASFKGTMTLVGCGLIWLSLLLLIFSMWVPWLAWLILPAFSVFLAMQFLRGFVEKREEPAKRG